MAKRKDTGWVRSKIVGNWERNYGDNWEATVTFYPATNAWYVHIFWDGKVSEVTRGFVTDDESKTYADTLHESK
jgi:hypothetical protein